MNFIPVSIYIRRFFPAFFIIMLSGSVNAQHCFPLYHKTYSGNGNDEARDILHTADKGSIVAGRSTSNTAGDFDAIVMKLNEQGDVIWSKRIGGVADDFLSRIKSTADGGYIAIGGTKSFGNAAGEVMIVKLDNAGTVSWSRHYSNSVNRTVPKEIIQLDNGDFVFTANENDSTVLSDAVVCRLDPAGNIIWAKRFNNGKDDGFNYVMEDGNTLYLTGYATVINRDAILMKLDKSNGSILDIKKYVHRINFEDEILNIYRTQNGIAFGAISYNPYDTYDSHEMTLFKIRNDGTIHYRRKADIFTSSGSKVSWINLIMSGDSSFVYLVHDSTNHGYPRVVRFSPTAMPEWSHQFFNTWESARLIGIDRGEDGYLFAGSMNSFYTSYKNHINVIKTTEEGYTADCTPGWIGDYEDTARYVISDFTWNYSGGYNATFNGPIPVASHDLTFTVSTVCGDTKCIGGPVIPDGCNASFSMKYKSLRAYAAMDVASTIDGGYSLIGQSFIFNSMEPFITRLKSNGDILWSKTLNDSCHTSRFIKSLNTSDGNQVIIGASNYVLNHGSRDYSVMMKINSNTGDVIWAHYFEDGANDMAATDDGGFVVCVNSRYGTGFMNNYVIRFDANGNIVWQRSINMDPYSPVYKSIIFEGPYIYISGDFYNTEPNNIAIIKLDALTGAKYWAKRYGLPGRSLLVKRVDRIADSLYVSVVAKLPDPSSLLHPAMICLNVATGDVFRAFELNGLSFTDQGANLFFNEHPHRTALKTADGQFLVGAQDIVPGGAAITFAKFSGTGQVSLARRYPALKDHYVSQIRENNGSFLVTCIKDLGIYDNSKHYESVLMKTGQDIKVIGAGTGDCLSEEVTNISSTPISLTPFNITVNSTPTTNIHTSNYLPYSRPLDSWAELSCNVLADCSTFDINGNSSVCNFSDTFLYSVIRNSSCQLGVTWQLSGTNANIISITDTTIKLHFINTGSMDIIAQMNTGCRILSDTLHVRVARNATTLDLGLDTTICLGNTIILNAGNGFHTYHWQNGTSASVYSVSSPGLYTVDVTDSCGNSFSDTVLVSLGNLVSIDIGPDREKCNNDTINLHAPAGFINYNWSPDYNINSLNAQSVVVNPSVDTSYFIKAEKTPGCFGFDTVHIKVYHSPAINLGADTSLCEGQSLLLDAGPGFTGYSWINGSIIQQAVVSNIGTYSVIGTTLQGCRSYDTLVLKQVYALPVVSLDHNPEICMDGRRILDAGAFSLYEWQDGSSDRTYTVSNPGTYYVSVIDVHGCKGSDTADITTVLPKPKDFLPVDTAVCSYSTITIQPTRAFNNYLWSNNSHASVISISQPSLYWLEVTDNKNCTGRDSILVLLKQCKQGVYVPAAFTPNVDGNNDKLKAMAFGNVLKFEFEIYNRYGQRVFQTNDINVGWDGMHLGSAQQTGTFVWFCRYQLSGETEKIIRGTSILMR